MAGTPDKVLSRDYDFEVNTGTIGAPVWTQINGLDEDGITISKSNRTVDFADADDGGLERPRVIGRGSTVSLKGSRMEAADDGTRDPGQAALEAVAGQMVTDAMLQFRITSPAAATPEVLTFMASVADVVPFGGSDKAQWTAELLVDAEPVVS